MLHPDTRSIKYFLFSQHLADGIRITLEIITPVIFFSANGSINTGLTIALGALCVSICDMPGPVDHKRNGMLYCNFFICCMAFLTGLANGNIILTGLLVTAAAFFFTMFSVYGIRAGSVGTAALLVMVLRLPNPVTIAAAFSGSLLILGGGTWYMCIALLFYRLRPYRPAQRALGDCLHETAKFLRIKAALYNTDIDFEEEYRKLVIQQVIVNEKQSAVRELLYKNRALLQEPSKMSKALVLAFADTLDLYEQINATWYDYKSLRNRFAPSGILSKVSEIINDLAIELDNIGLAIQANISYKSQYRLMEKLDELKIKIDAFDDSSTHNLVLKKILVNLRNHGRHMDELMSYFGGNKIQQREIRNKKDYSRFVAHQEISPVILKNNLNLKSGIFRHALRMMISCLAGFVIAKLISTGHHSYWILLTIIVLLKPGFSLTKERNIQRFAGTIAGGIIGLSLLKFMHNRDALFGLIIFFMLGTYTFQRLNYIIMVVFTTPYVIILLSLLAPGTSGIAAERLLDTGIACVLSLAASYLLFPRWESYQVAEYMQSVLKANIDYLEKLLDFFGGRQISVIDYKLARKEVYTSTANLAGAFNRMLSEPKSKQAKADYIYEFIVLNNVLSANLASLSGNLIRNEKNTGLTELVPALKRSAITLQESLEALEGVKVENCFQVTAPGPKTETILPDQQLMEQVSFMLNVSKDIRKIANQFKEKA